MDDNVGGGGGAVTSRVAAALLVTPSCKAVISVVPAERPEARPEPSIVATAIMELAHVAVDVRSAVLSSSKWPVAVNCCVCPSSIDALAGVTEMDDNVGAGAGAASSIVTLNRASTRSIRLANVRVELPANSSPTGLLLLSSSLVTIRDPESPPLLKSPSSMAI